MEKKRFNLLRNAAYSLIELSVTLALVGIVAGTALSLATTKSEKDAQVATRSNLNAIEDALKRYVNYNNRLPCPAIPALSDDNAGYGLEDDCSLAAASDGSIVELSDGTPDEIWVGSVPIRTLGLPDRFALDHWNNRFTYAVPKNFATDGNNLRELDADNTATMITVQDKGGSQMNPADTANPVIYVLMSHGQDKRGAYTRAGTLSAGCASTNTQIDIENCDIVDSGNEDHIFIDGELNASTDNAEYFHDLVRWKTKVSLGAVNAVESTPATPATPPSGGIVTAAKMDVWNANTFIITPTGELWGTGLDDDGALGNGGGGGGHSTSFQLIDGNTDWIKVEGNDWGIARCGLRGNGRIYCWGYRGDWPGGNDITANAPAEHGGTTVTYTDWEDMAYGGKNLCGIRNGGQLWCWGENSNGELGVGDTTDKNNPTQVTGAGAGVWTDVSLGTEFGCGIMDGNLYCWGRHYMGTMGTGSSSWSINHTPVLINGDGDWDTVTSNFYNSCAIKAGGELYCWGRKTSGQVGDGAGGSYALSPTRVDATISDWTYVHIGGGHGNVHRERTVCGVRATGEGYCWGANDEGELGIAGLIDYNTPQPVAPAITDWKVMQSTGTLSGCGVRTGGELHCWGKNTNGVFGNGGNSSSIVLPTEITAAPDVGT